VIAGPDALRLRADVPFEVHEADLRAEGGDCQRQRGEGKGGRAGEPTHAGFLESM